VEFVMKLAGNNQTGMVNYTNFVRYLDKKFVRSFKYAEDLGNDDSGAVIDDAEKTAVDLLLEKPLQKEASIMYVLRKAA
jgi:hypothetical protein